MIPTAALRQRIAIRPYLGSGGEGPQYGAVVEGVPCRFVGKRRAVRTAQGVDVIADATADIRPTLPVIAESEVTHEGDVYDVLAVSDAVELTRPHHRTLILQGPRP